jgi:hypothetical protein
VAGPNWATVSDLAGKNHCSVPPFIDRHTQAKNDPDQYISRLCVGGREAFRKLFAHDRQLSTPNYVKVGALGYRLTFVKSICMRRKTGARGGSRTPMAIVDAQLIHSTYRENRNNRQNRMSEVHERDTAARMQPSVQPEPRAVS